MTVHISRLPVVPTPGVEVVPFAAQLDGLFAIDGELDVVSLAAVVLEVSVNVKVVNVVDPEVVTRSYLEAHLAPLHREMEGKDCIFDRRY